jgi:hypothetical protein
MSSLLHFLFSLRVELGDVWVLRYRVTADRIGDG